MPSVRSITFFIPIDNWENIEVIEDYFNRSLEIVDSSRINPWTIRFVLPPISADIGSEECIKTIFKLYDKIPDRKILLHLLSIESGSKCIGKIPEILSATENTYMTIFLKNEVHIPDIVDKIYLKDLDPYSYTRISITHYGTIQTPYFPSTSNIKNLYAFSLALRYVDVFRSYLKENNFELLDFLKRIDEEVSEYKELFLGIDYSLSPWMEESVGYLIEDIYNMTLGEPGSYNAVYDLNMEIKNLEEKSSLKSLGFNEVMLPVGEDNLLKERVREGRLRLGLLEGLSAVCVAGLDMVNVFKDRDILIRIIRDMDRISKIKKKPIGTRLIPTMSDSVKIGKFGEVPIIKL